MPPNVSPLVSTDWLYENINSDKIRILDVSWHFFMDVSSEYKENHISGASFFDLVECSDKSTDLLLMLPDADTFSNYVSELGIDNNTHVIVYDNSAYGVYTAPRLWWMFRMYGHGLVSILDGGLSKWMCENKPVTKEVVNYPSKIFNSEVNPALVKTYDQMVENLDSQEFQMIDARTDIDDGSIIRSTHVPFVNYLYENSKTFKKPNELRNVLTSAGIDLNKPMVSYCLGGVLSCFLPVVSVLCDLPIVAQYDGSFQEWSLKANPGHIESI